MQRRAFLERVGLAAATGALAGCPSSSVPTTTPPTSGTQTPTSSIPHADAYADVVDLTAVGARPDASEPINSVLEAYAGDDTLLALPGGRYLLDPLELSGLSTVAIAAAGGGRPTFVPARPRCVRGEPYVRFDDVSNFLLEGVTFDFRERGAESEIHVFASGDVTVRDVRSQGSCDAQISAWRFDVREPSASALVESLVLENPPSNGSRLTGVFVGEEHAGEITFRDCAVEGFSDNGLYASAPGDENGRDGVVHVEGGTYRNNNVANVRLGSTGSTARGVRVAVDRTPPTADRVNARGIRLRWRRGQVVEDCVVTIGSNAGYGFGGIVCHPDNAGATVRDTRVAVDRNGVPAVNAMRPVGPAAAGLRFENLTVTGSAAGGYAVLVDGRDGTTFRGCTVRQTGTNRGGIHLVGVEDGRILDSRIDVTGGAIRLDGASVEIRNTTVVGPDGREQTLDTTVDARREPVQIPANGTAPAGTTTDGAGA